MEIRSKLLHVLMIAALLAAALLTGCGEADDQTAAEESLEPTVEEKAAETVDEAKAALNEAEKKLVATVAAVSTAMEQAPATAEAVLRQHGMSADEYEAAKQRIKEDPRLAEALDKLLKR